MQTRAHRFRLTVITLSTAGLAWAAHAPPTDGSLKQSRHDKAAGADTAAFFDVYLDMHQHGYAQLGPRARQNETPEKPKPRESRGLGDIPSSDADQAS